MVAPAAERRQAEMETYPTEESLSKELLYHRLGVRMDNPDDDNGVQTNNCADLEAEAFVVPRRATLVAPPWTQA